MDDLFVFQVPCSLSVGMLPNFTISVDDYKSLISSPDTTKSQEVLPNKLQLNEFVERLKNNNLF